MKLNQHFVTISHSNWLFPPSPGLGWNTMFRCPWQQVLYWLAFHIRSHWLPSGCMGGPISPAIRSTLRHWSHGTVLYCWLKEVFFVGISHQHAYFLLVQENLLLDQSNFGDTEVPTIRQTVLSVEIMVQERQEPQTLRKSMSVSGNPLKVLLCEKSLCLVADNSLCQFSSRVVFVSPCRYPGYHLWSQREQTGLVLPSYCGGARMQASTCDCIHLWRSVGFRGESHLLSPGHADG